MEPFDNEMIVEQPRMLRRGFEAMLNSGIFARSTVLSDLPFPVREIEKIAALPHGMLAESNVYDLQVALRSEKRELMDLESGKVVQFPRRWQ